MATERDDTAGSGGSGSTDPLAAMKALGRPATPDPKPARAAKAPTTGAAAFVARQNRPKRGRAGAIAAAVLGLTLGAGLGAWALVGATPKLVAAGEDAAKAEKADAEIESARRKQADDLVALDQKRERKAAELAESEKQVEALQKRRDELQKQITDLTGPLSSPEAEAAAERRRQAAADEPQAQSDARAQPLPPRAPRSTVTVDGRIAGAPEAPRDVEPSLEADEDRLSPADDTPTDLAAANRDERAAPPDDGGGRAAGPVRVFIHVRAGDPDARLRAEDLADRLRREGVEVAGIRGVPHAVRTDTVRFFYDDDESAVSTLERALSAGAGGRGGPPIAQDFRNRRVAPRKGTLEIWLS